MKHTLTIIAVVLLHVAYTQNVNTGSPIPKPLRTKALQIIPETFHKHPEFGKFSLDIPADNIELIHLRTAEARTFLDETGKYHTQQTGGTSNYKDENGWLVSMQESVSKDQDRAGIFRTEMPLYVDLLDGTTTLTLEKKGRSASYGKNTSMLVLDRNMNQITSISSQYEGSNSIDGNEIRLNDYFSNVDRIQNLTYWSLQTDFLIKSRMQLDEQAAFIQFDDELVLPQGWDVVYGKGEMTTDGWQGTLRILDERGRELSTISMPTYYDSFHANVKEAYEGHAMLGFYTLEKSANGYKIGLRVPVSWLNSDALVYPVRIDPTASNTYASIQSFSDNATTFSGACEASMNVTIPLTNFQVTGTATSYNVYAKGTIASGHFAWGSEQKSRVGVGSSWTGTQTGTGTSSSPATCNYNLTGQTIANGCYNSGVSTITYKFQGYQTFFPYGCGHGVCNVYGCVTNYQELVANTWSVTTTYSAVTLAVDAGPSVTICGGTSANLNATVTGATSMTWTPATMISNTAIANPLVAPTTTTVYTLTVVNGACSYSDNVTITVTPLSSTGMAAGDWVFTGAVSTTYEDPNNWLVWSGSSFSAVLMYAGQSAIRPPQITNNVRIKPNGGCITNQPTVTNAADAGFTAPNSVSANCQSIVIESGAALTFSSNASHFHVALNWNNSGTMTPSNGRVKFIGTGAQSIVNSSGSQSFYEMNVGANSVTSLSSTNVTVTNALRLNGIVVTGANVLHLSNSAADATSLPAITGHVNGTLRRSIAANTNVYAFPVGVGSTLTTHRRLLEFVNNNISGVSYLDCNVSNTFKGSGANIDALLDPLKAFHALTLFNVINSAAEWRLTPNTNPSGGNYGVRLYLQNFSSLTDNNFTVLKRPDASLTFFDYSAFYTTTSIPTTGAAGRIYSGGAGYAQKTGFTTFSKFAVASASTPLPVQLLNFSASCEGNTEISWSTGSEQNSQKFTVEKSRDLVSWEFVAEEAAAGNSNYEISYSATDADPLDGISYYRLVQADNDGIEKIYGPISVSCGDMEDGMTVFPNPSHGVFTVEIMSSEPLFEGEVQIIDMAGKIVERRSIQVIEGANQALFERLDLQAGAYFVRLAGSEFKPVKVIVN